MSCGRWGEIISQVRLFDTAERNVQFHGSCRLHSSVRHSDDCREFLYPGCRIFVLHV